MRLAAVRSRLGAEKPGPGVTAGDSDSARLPLSWPPAWRCCARRAATVSLLPASAGASVPAGRPVPAGQLPAIQERCAVVPCP